MPLNIPIDEEDLNAIGTGPELDGQQAEDQIPDFEEGQIPAPRPTFYNEATANADPDADLKSQIVAAIKGSKKFSTKFEEQRDALQELLGAGEGKTMEIPCDSAKEAVRVRMRFYRCKDELRKAGNTLYDRIVITLDGRTVRLTFPRKLTRRIVDEG